MTDELERRRWWQKNLLESGGDRLDVAVNAAQALWLREEEIERLRARVAELESRPRARVAELESRPRARVAELESRPRALMDEHLDRVVEGAKAAERAAIVAWLRLDGPGDEASDMADAIEKGLHHMQTPEVPRG